MPPLVNVVPRYRLHQPSRQAVLTHNGRMTSLGRWKSPESKEKYDRVTAEWLARGRLPAPAISANKLPVNEIILRYMLWAQTDYVKDGKPTGELGALKLALRGMKECYGSTPAEMFDSCCLEAVRAKMIDKGWVRTSINLPLAGF